MVLDPQVWSEPSLIGSDRRFILAVCTYRNLCFCENSLKCLLLVDEQIASARPDEDLDSWYPSSDLERFNVLLGGSHIEAIVDQRFGRRNRILLLDELLVDRRRLGVGHLQVACYSASRASPAGSPQILLVGQPRFAKMDLVVHQPRKKDQFPCIDNMVGTARRGRIHRRYLAVAQQYIAHCHPVGKNHLGVADQRRTMLSSGYHGERLAEKMTKTKFG